MAAVELLDADAVVFEHTVDHVLDPVAGDSVLAGSSIASWICFTRPGISDSGTPAVFAATSNLDFMCSAKSDPSGPLGPLRRRRGERTDHRHHASNG